MRDDFAEFEKRGAAIAVIIHDDEETIADYWRKNNLPYVGIPDPEGAIAERYGQEWRLFRGGRMPALFIIDRQRRLRATHRGRGMKDIPSNASVLAELDRISSQNVSD